MVPNILSRFGKSESTDSVDTWEDDIETLFEMSTVYMEMDDNLGFSSVNTAAICFAEVKTDRFNNLIDSIVDLIEDNSNTTSVSLETDSHDYQWMVFEDTSYQELITNIHFVSQQFVDEGYSSRLVAALYGFENSSHEQAYWVYSYQRNGFYPFVPVDGERRNSSLEFKLESMFSETLTIEKNKQYWHPLWPDSGKHPWSTSRW